MGLFDDFEMGGNVGGNEGRELDRIPEADYKVTILDTEIDTEKQRVGFRLHFPGLFGENGISRWKSNSVKTQKAFNFLLSELKKIGIEPKTKQEVEAGVKDARGLVVTVQVKNQKNSDKYQDFYFVRAEGRDRTITAIDSAMKPDANVTDVADDDLPF